MIKITFHYRYRKQILIGTIILIVIIISISLGIIYYPKLSKEKAKDIIPAPQKNTLKKDDSTKEELAINYKVDIKGQIKNPGIYTMTESSRVIDQTCTIMIQKLTLLFARNPLNIKEI